jgi:hypothetical protein
MAFLFIFQMADRCIKNIMKQCRDAGLLQADFEFIFRFSSDF